jgi:hypothetical protein
MDLNADASIFDFLWSILSLNNILAKYNPISNLTAYFCEIHINTEHTTGRKHPARDRAVV